MDWSLDYCLDNVYNNLKYYLYGGAECHIWYKKSFMNTGVQALYIIKDLLIMFYFTVTLQTNFFVPEITVILAFPFFSALILPFL